MTTADLTMPISEDILRRRWWILGVLCTSLLVVMLGNTALNIVLPTLSRVMGAAGAMIMPSTLSILTNVFPREERAKAVAIWSGIAGGGGAIGMLLSGFIIQNYDWSAVFLVVVPVVIASLVAGWFSPFATSATEDLSCNAILSLALTWSRVAALWSR